MVRRLALAFAIPLAICRPDVVRAGQPFDVPNPNLDQQDGSEATPTPDPVNEARMPGQPSLEEPPRSDGDETAGYDLAVLKRHTAKVGWEVAGLAVATTATRFKDVTKGGSSFHFKREGWFGKGTGTLGMDKLHHAWKAYVFADVLQSIIENRTGEKRGAAYSGAMLSLSMLTYAEILDGFTGRTGFSGEDMVVHFAGAGLSVARNVVPGLRDKIDFRMEFKPTSKGEELRLANQLAHRKYLLAVQMAGFERWKETPLRYLEVHAGYYARGFSDVERARGDPLRRRLYLGLGLNIQQLFSRRPKSGIERMAKGAFDYVQLPYTSIRTR